MHLINYRLQKPIKSQFVVELHLFEIIWTNKLRYILHSKYFFIYLLSTSVKGSFDLLHDQVYLRKQKYTKLSESNKLN